MVRSYLIIITFTKCTCNVLKIVVLVRYLEYFLNESRNKYIHIQLYLNNLIPLTLKD